MKYGLGNSIQEEIIELKDPFLTPFFILRFESLIATSMSTALRQMAQPSRRSKGKNMEERRSGTFLGEELSDLAASAGKRKRVSISDSPHETFLLRDSELFPWQSCTFY